jgi:hypothetical protein
MEDMVATVTVTEMTGERAAGLPKGARRAKRQLTGISRCGRGCDPVGVQVRDSAGRATIGCEGKRK